METSQIVKILGNHISNKDLDNEFDIYEAMKEYGRYCIDKYVRENLQQDIIGIGITYLGELLPIGINHLRDA